ncbi:leucine-rich repeat domain-containing protein [Salinimicrobium sediminilitoris]|uniref:hypothetical protein n=1 Tax=Salinimicrobium sediminilitoris TaxID=2876715 RepID=UPI001E454D61|nr:hypothetical protein [Salinimicrobium sediminilitoris]MCC8360057.1 hypothetical protein [Salinimicrobium sediminilitoris]
MKKTLPWLLPLFIFSFLSSCEPEGPGDKDPEPPVAEDIIEIPDEHFKHALVNTNSIDTNGDHVGDSNIDLNNDGEIQRSEANSIRGLVIHFNYNDFNRYVDLKGIENFVNLEYFKMTGDLLFEEIDHELLSYDLSNLKKLRFLEMNNLGTNAFKDLDLQGLADLEELKIINSRPDYSKDGEDYGNPLNFMDVNLAGTPNLTIMDITNSFLNIDFCQVPSLKRLNMFYLEGGEPEIFDFHCLTELEWLNISENRIKSLILKNSSILNTLLVKDIGYYGINYPFVEYICIDDFPEEHEQIATLIDEHTVVVTDCSF